MTIYSYFVIFYTLFINSQMKAFNISEVMDNLDHYSRSRTKRQLPLIYNGRVVTYQFICGFGLPFENLQYETVTSGVVFKAQYFLPSRTEQLYNRNTTNLNEGSAKVKGKRRRDILNKNFRWHFYKLLEYWGNNLGLDGYSCVLKSICEVTQQPFNLDSGHLWEELVYILFQPQTSVDDEQSTHFNKDYLKATQWKNSTCDELYKECPRSLINQFTKTFLHF